MLFNSYIYIFAFLPVVFFTYFFLLKRGMLLASKVLLVFASLFFYSWWNIKYLPLILISMFVNYAIGTALSNNLTPKYKKHLLIFGIVFNVGLLGYFKYADFFIQNINFIANTDIPLLHLALPLAISFFTFQQIAYLVDSYKGETKEYDLLNYMVFVSFFPQLIAGPIVHHKEMMPQFEDKNNKKISYKNITAGLFIFAVGLFKKAVIADSLSPYVAQGFDFSTHLGFLEAWSTTLAYAMQLYYDFSGYTDMAIGSALLFNIRLPINFNSPYKAVNIQDFWRRWHITLSRFLRDYIYIPLGGNRKGRFRTYYNLFITFLIGGIWHGAGWTFVFWGFLHGIGMVVHRIFKELGYSMNRFAGWFITFVFVNVTWVFFRAKEWDDAIKVLKGMVGLNGWMLPENKNIFFGADNYITLMVLFGAMFAALLWQNSMQMLSNLKPGLKTAVVGGGVFAFSTLFLTRVSEFLYFNF
ncbi:MAG: MBOAT family protein [Epsilonproteobacteria bacterium]|nr:MBOAT family protein [Campylobacterota bacterium]